MYRSMHRSPDDAYDISNSPDPSPSTAALMAPYGTLTPAPVSRTRDGKPRVMDLNNLGLTNGAKQQDPQKYSPPPQKANKDITGHSYTEKSTSPFDSLVSPDLDSGYEQRLDNTLNHAHQTYMREVHGVTTPTDGMYSPTMARPLNPVPIQSPLGWEQDKARRARRAADRIQHEYVNELRMISRPSVKASTPGEVQLDQMRARMQTKQPLGAGTVPASFNFMNPTMYMPSTSTIKNPSLNHSSIPNLTATSSASPPVTFYPTSPLPNAPTWTENTSHNVKQNIIDEARQKEIELDEKRRQLLTKKKGKHGKSKKKKKDKASKKDVHVYPEQQVSQQQAQYQVQQPAHYPDQHPVQQATQYLSQQQNQPVQKLGAQNTTQDAASGMQYLPHRPSAPPKKDGEDGESFNKRRRRIIAKVAGSEGKEVCIVIKDIIPEMKPCPDDVTNHTYTENADIITNGRPMIAPTETAKAERFTDNPTMHQGQRIRQNDIIKASDPPAPIPRQTSQQAIGWNSDAAKRGLGFKSKLRREAVQENNIKKPENKAGLTPEIRNKWKKATFY